MQCQINAENRQLQERIESIRKFRHQHEELQNVIVRVLSTATAASLTGANPSKDIKEAYEQVLGIDCLDMSTGAQLAIMRMPLIMWLSSRFRGQRAMGSHPEAV
jgi:hypothetical protein